jgi:hypothetical protein
VKFFQLLEMELLPPFSGYSEEEGSKLLRNVGKFVSEYTVSLPRRDKAS